MPSEENIKKKVINWRYVALQHVITVVLKSCIVQKPLKALYDLHIPFVACSVGKLLVYSS